MEAVETKLKGCYILQPKIFKDDRGYFFESFNKHIFEKITGNNSDFLQDNQSYSKYGTIRGLHFQKGEYAQAKLVRVVKGEVLDVAVDLRIDSPTYGEHISVVLSAENFNQLYIPRDFAHGFSVLSDDAIFVYKCDAVYNKESEAGIIYNDYGLGIDWKIPDDKVSLSAKDASLITFKEFSNKIK